MVVCEWYNVQKCTNQSCPYYNQDCPDPDGSVCGPVYYLGRGVPRPID